MADPSYPVSAPPNAEQTALQNSQMQAETVRQTTGSEEQAHAAQYNSNLQDAYKPANEVQSYTERAMALAGVAGNAMRGVPISGTTPFERPNFYEYVSGKRQQYETELDAYNRAGASSPALYQELTQKRAELVQLENIGYYADMTRSINKQVMEQSQPQPAKDFSFYDALAPAGSQQRMFVEGAAQQLESIPERFTSLSGFDVSPAIRFIQSTAPKETVESTSREKEFLSGAYDFAGRIPNLISRSVGFAGSNPELTPLGFVGGGGYAQESKLLIPAAGAVVAGLVLSAGQRSGYDLSPITQRAQELWEGIGSPIQTPGAFNLPKITDVIPASVFNAPGEGYNQIVNAPGEGYRLIVNLPGEGRNLIAKASEAIPMPSFGGGITDVIQFPRSTILPTDVITPVYDLTSKVNERVTEMGRVVVTERPIFDLRVDVQAKEAIASLKKTVSEGSTDYATNLAASAESAFENSLATPYWWARSAYQSRVVEKTALAIPAIYARPAIQSITRLPAIDINVPDYYGGSRPRAPDKIDLPRRIILPGLPSLDSTLSGSGYFRNFRRFTERLSFGGLGWTGLSVGANARRLHKTKINAMKKKKK